jgi:hypothetical protein
VGFDLTLIGTAAMPLHASALPGMMRCPLSAVLRMRDDDAESGPAADTGSAVHFAVHLWHGLAKGSASVAVAAMRKNVDAFPAADLTAAEEQFLYYTEDPRNQEAEVIHSEERIRVTIEDPTGEEAPVVIIGTMDQLRRNRYGQLELCDIKTGSVHDGMSMLHVHAFQLAAYQVGAAQLTGEEVPVAKIIRTQDYYPRPRAKTPGPVFWEAPWSFEQAGEMLAGVAQVVYGMRRGNVWAGPSTDCFRFCPARGPQNCLLELGGLKHGGKV